MSVGLVVVSHSRVLARAAVALAQEMLHGKQIRINVAAGLDETTFGTDAAAIVDAITAADHGDGVVVLMDLGSAVLSAELACELLDDDVRERVRLCPAPLVEGLVVAAVAAAGGAPVDEVAAEAAGALAGKIGHLGPTPVGAVADEPDGVDEVSGAFVVANPHGLHARPAARLVQEVRRRDARARIRNRSTDSGWVDAGSLSKLATLGVRCGDEVEVRVSGSQAAETLDHVLALAGRNFDESLTAPTVDHRTDCGACPDRCRARPGNRPGPLGAPGRHRGTRRTRRGARGRMASAEQGDRSRAPHDQRAAHQDRPRGWRGRSGDLRRPPTAARRRRLGHRGAGAHRCGHVRACGVGGGGRGSGRRVRRRARPVSAGQSRGRSSGRRAGAARDARHCDDGIGTRGGADRDRPDPGRGRGTGSRSKWPPCYWRSAARTHTT